MLCNKFKFIKLLPQKQRTTSYPILLYIIEFAVIGGLTAALGGFFETASAVVSAIIVIVTAVLLSLLAYILDKKNIILKL